jgi:putative endonuclease
VTSDLAKRVGQHKGDLVDGFTRRYREHTLVGYELHSSMASAIHREKAIKKWKRKWKPALIEKDHPCWRDLYEDLA